MRIYKAQATDPRIAAEHEMAGRAEKQDGQFLADLHRNQDSQARERLENLLQKIDESGQRLGAVPTYTELKTYRELIRDFLGEAVGRMYVLHSQGSWDRHGRQKMYSIVKNIDNELADLTENVRQGQEKRMNIMARLDAIRGMLVDLYT